MPDATPPTTADLQVKPTAPIEPPASVAKATKPAPNEQFEDKMRRLGGDDVFERGDPKKVAAEKTEASGDAKDEDAKADDAEKPEPEKPAKKPKAAKPVDVSPDAEEEQLRALAEKRGYTLENGRVTTVERAKFREERRTHSEALKTAEANALAKIEEARKSFDTELSSARALQAAVDSGDANALAKALGREDWNKLQEHFLSHQADPNYKRVLELEEWKRKTEAEREESEKKRVEQEQQQARVQAQNQYRARLSGEMKGSKDPLIASMAEDPLFIGAIFNIQNANWDGSSTVTPEQALKLVPRGGRSLYDEMKQLHERLGKAFGAAAPVPAGTAAAVVPDVKKKGPPPPATPRPSKLNRNLERSEFLRNAERRLLEAQVEERRSELNGKRTGS